MPTMNRTEAMDNASILALTRQAPNNLFWIAISPLAVITNILILITILKSKPLHTKSQLIICSYILAQTLYMSSYLYSGLVRYIYYSLEKPETSNQLICILKQFPLTLTGCLMKPFAFVLALDRFMCLALPLRHKTLDMRKYLLIVNTTVWSYVFLMLSIAFIYGDKNTYLPICTYLTSFHPTHVAYINADGKLWTCITAVTYVISAGIMYQRHRKTSFANGMEKREWKRRMEWDVFVSVTVLGLLNFTTAGLNGVFNLIAGTQSSEAAALYSRLISMCSFANSTLDFLVFLKFNRTFRREFVKMWKKKEQLSQVGPMIIN